MTFQRRLSRLEETRGGRCPQCRPWHDFYVQYNEQEQERDGHIEHPGACPKCGWEPVLIRVVYEDMPPDDNAMATARAHDYTHDGTGQWFY